jgi:hypothetical protein
VSAPEIVYESTWDNALGLLVQKTMYPDVRSPLTVYDASKLEPFFRTAIEKEHEWYQCRGLPLNSEPPFGFRRTPEALARMRSIDALLTQRMDRAVMGAEISKAETGDAKTDPTEWNGHGRDRKATYDDLREILHLRSQHCNRREPGFEPTTRNLNHPFHFPYTDSAGSARVFMVEFWKEIVALMVLPILYGGIHLMAWNFDFPTPEEQLLWKIACIGIPLMVPGYILGMIMGVSLAGLVWYVMVSVFGSVYVRGQDITDITGATVIRMLRRTTYVMMAIGTIPRVYIVVESFIGLRQVPIGVYWTPAWLQMIPHV